MSDLSLAPFEGEQRAPKLPPSLGDLLANPAPPPQWRIRGLVPAGTTILGGYAKVGKSTAVEQIALSYASGTPLFGEKAFRVSTNCFYPEEGENLEAGTALYVDAENGLSILESRWRRMKDAEPAFARPEALSRIFVDSITRFQLTGEGFDRLCECLERWEAIDSESSPTLIVFDSLRRLWSGDEISSQEVAQLFRNVATLRKEFCLSSLILHHTIKGRDAKRWQDDIRGSSDLYAATDSLLLLQKTSPTEAVLRVSGRIVPDYEVRLRFDPKTMLFAIRAGKVDAEQEQLAGEAAVLEAVRKFPGSSGRALVKQLGRKASTVYATLHELERRKPPAIVKDGQGWRCL